MQPQVSTQDTTTLDDHQKDLLHTIFPWMLAILIGVLTAITGHSIGVTADYLSDIRFGYCRGYILASHKRCCGESSFRAIHERCVPLSHTQEDSSQMEWVPWPRLLGMEYLFGRWASLPFSYIFYVASSALMAGIAAWLVSAFCPDARGGGIAEVRAAVAGFDLPKSLSGWCLLIKTLGLSLAMGAGLELLEDDPLVHLAACWAQVIQRGATTFLYKIQLPSIAVMPLHEIACIGVATGMATAFGTPLGGVLFALEEFGAVRALPRRTLVFAFTSAFVASLLQKYLATPGFINGTVAPAGEWTGDSGRGQLLHAVEWMGWEMYIFLLIGVLSGFGGVLFIRLNRWCIGQRQASQERGQLWLLPNCLRSFIFSSRTRLASYQPSMCALSIFECMVVASLTSSLNYPFTPLLRNSPTQAIHALLTRCPLSSPELFGLCDTITKGDPNVSVMAHISLLFVCGVRVMEAAFIFGAAVPSGVFMPSLFIGASLGRLIGNVVLLYYRQFHNSSDIIYIDPGKFAAVGAVAMLAGFRRMTVSLVMIIFEMTGEYTYIVPFMCAVLTAKLVGDYFAPSVYESHAQLNGYALVREQCDLRLQMCVADLLIPLHADDLVDITKLVPMQTLATWARRRYVLANTDSAFTGASCTSNRLSVVPSGNRVMHSSPVLLLWRRQRASTKQIVGVVWRKELREWLAHQDLAAAGFCSFKRPVAEPANAEMYALTGGASAASVIDGVGLVDGVLAFLSAHAPLLTAYCVFTQKPELRCCVCANERDSGFSVLSREDFFTALSRGQFALAHWPVLGGNTPINSRPASPAIPSYSNQVASPISHRCRKEKDLELQTVEPQTVELAKLSRSSD